jgi:hypothetical protein
VIGVQRAAEHEPPLLLVGSRGNFHREMVERRPRANGQWNLLESRLRALVRRRVLSGRLRAAGDEHSRGSSG